jgi:hypothetical protein
MTFVDVKVKDDSRRQRNLKKYLLSPFVLRFVEVTR